MINNIQKQFKVLTMMDNTKKLTKKLNKCQILTNIKKKVYP